MFFAIRAAPDEIPVRMVRTIWKHTESCLAKRGTVLIDVNLIRDGFGAAALRIKIDKCPDVMCLQEFVCGVIIPRRVASSPYRRDRPSPNQDTRFQAAGQA